MKDAGGSPVVMSWAREPRGPDYGSSDENNYQCASSDRTLVHCSPDTGQRPYFKAAASQPNLPTRGEMLVLKLRTLNFFSHNYTPPFPLI
jgi:hypothetical protein